MENPVFGLSVITFISSSSVQLPCAFCGQKHDLFIYSFIHLNTYMLWVYTAIRNILILMIISARDLLYTSESDICRRLIMTYKDDPRTLK